MILNWRRAARLLGFWTAGLGTALGPAGGHAQDAATGAGYRPATAVPATWQQFAQHVQQRIGEWLRGEDEDVRRFHTYLQDRSTGAPAAPEALVIKIWIAADGKVDRVDFPPLPDAQASADLRVILERGRIDQPPPPDMLQPMHLKVALKWQ